MLDNSERYPLQQIILEDQFSANKLAMILMLSVVATALGTIWITHQTRGLVAEKNELVLQHQALEDEFLNLKLEEATRSDNTRIEAFAAGKLKMKAVSPDQEVLILE
ncbi:cell division protein FtsL [Caviibacterium pharyngocola]|uniref:Cell division protein FtsL n=1 Tax=Caviibacterium pharyngocola TaxID=28159 RepID=A0A2M8RVS6_9PAST|nr:cell division protein FtsL [Caviibacterium pharyngocola]PJG82994.1 cell division protein FtsL [Caviibacterium pharyngocola]